MKVLLIVPKVESHYFVPPISLGYLAQSLINSKIDVKIIDGIKDNLTLQKLDKILEKENPDFVGFQVYSSDVNTVNEYIKLIKSKFPKIKTLVGGAHVTGVSKAIFKDFPELDYAFQGEAEFPLPKFLIKKDFKVPGLIYKKGNKIIANPSKFEENLDKIKMPTWQLIDPRDYPKAPQGAVFRNYPVAPISTSRGCPYNCTFCANHITSGRKIRYRSIKNVVDEIEFLQKNYDVKEIHIIDDVFTENKARVKEFYDEVTKRKLKFTLALPNGIRLNSLDEEILILLKELGCYSTAVGIESGSQKILNDMRKNLTLKLIEEKINLIKKVGITISAFFIIGYPTESKEDILKTINFAKKLKIDRAHFSTFLPLPGTEITNRLIKEGKLKDLDYSSLSYIKAPLPPEGMTSNELKALQRKAFLEFYLRPRIILGMMKEIKSYDHFKILLKRAVDYAFRK